MKNMDTEMEKTKVEETKEIKETKESGVRSKQETESAENVSIHVQDWRKFSTYVKVLLAMDKVWNSALTCSRRLQTIVLAFKRC